MDFMGFSIGAAYSLFLSHKGRGESKNLRVDAAARAEYMLQALTGLLAVEA
jgi:hypothetical protein